jgi:uncharacterized protein (DUF2141 family)
MAVAAPFMMMAPHSAEAANVDVTVHVVGIANQKGEVFAALYDEAGWKADHALSSAHVPVNSSDLTIKLTVAAPGKYAIKMFQDLHGTGELHTNFIGIPDEPYAFSNNATGSFGPPSFDASAFDVGPEGAAQTIQLH